MYTSLQDGSNSKLMGPEVRDPATLTTVQLEKSLQLETFLGQSNAHSQLPLRAKGSWACSWLCSPCSSQF